MKENSLIDLNKTIYGLLIVIGFELSVFTIVALFNTFGSSDGKYVVISKEPEVLISSKRDETERFVASVSPQTIESKVKKTMLSPIKIAPKNYNDVVKIETPLVKPILYTKTIKLDEANISQKKRTFIDMILPSILIAKHYFRADRRHLLALLKKNKLTVSEELWLKKKRELFNAKSNDDLYNKMEMHPTSIIMAQAIIESGWGSSRFFNKANNVFGIWSFSTKEKRIAASEKRDKKTIYLKKYSSIEESVADYLVTLSSKDAYKEFREKRLDTQDPLKLIHYLGNYSELRDEYIQKLKNTIQTNKLIDYDSYHLDI